jgi:hypothetical protein
MVVAGFLLTGVSWWFFLLAGLGTFGPGILRELNWLHDQDEFQRRTQHRAGYHAFLITGLIAFGLIAFVRSGARTMKDPQELGTLFLALLWCTWFFSWLIDYWGTQKTAARILYGFAWLVFTIISNTGSEWTGWRALLMHPLLTIPFFAMAWLSTRKPLIAGILLLAAAVYFFQFFGFFRREHIGLITQSVTCIVFMGPLIATGVALICVGNTGADDEVVDMT